MQGLYQLLVSGRQIPNNSRGNTQLGDSSGKSRHYVIEVRPLRHRFRWTIASKVVAARTCVCVRARVCVFVHVRVRVSVCVFLSVYFSDMQDLIKTRGLPAVVLILMAVLPSAWVCVCVCVGLSVGRSVGRSVRPSVCSRLSNIPLAGR